jgi:type VI protein secretion system component VasF
MSSDPATPEPVEEQSAHQPSRKKHVRKKAHRRSRISREQVVLLVVAAGVILAMLGTWYFLADLLD